MNVNNKKETENYDLLLQDSKYYWSLESSDFVYIWACIDNDKTKKGGVFLNFPS